MICAMKSLLILLQLLALSYVGIGQTQTYLIESDTPFTANSSIEIIDTTKYKYGPGTTIYKIEKGSLNGVRYSFHYLDGSGTFQGKPGSDIEKLGEPDNWKVACKKDPIDDSVLCYMAIHDLTIGITSISGTHVIVGDKQGGEAFIRIDGEVPFRTQPDGIFSRSDTTKILERLKSAKTVVTRHGRNKIDKTWDMYGFNETLHYINWAFGRVKTK